MEQSGSHNVYAGRAPADTVIQARNIEHVSVHAGDADTPEDPYAGRDVAPPSPA